MERNTKRKKNQTSKYFTNCSGNRTFLLYEEEIVVLVREIQEMERRVREPLREHNVNRSFSEEVIFEIRYEIREVGNQGKEHSW